MSASEGPAPGGGGAGGPAPAPVIPPAFIIDPGNPGGGPGGAATASEPIPRGGMAGLGIVMLANDGPGPAVGSMTVIGGCGIEPCCGGGGGGGGAGPAPLGLVPSNARMTSGLSNWS